MVEFHPEAQGDLNELWERIAADNLVAADELIAEIEGTLETVAAFPQQGHKRTDLTSLPIRFIVVRNYLIAYACEEKPIFVVAVFHGQRSQRVMAAILRGREP
jgi:plasmid stabilization system protein ParE